jgi:non-specific serine/threonine protein kinase
VLDNFEDGVWWVELASLVEPQLVAQEVLLVLELHEEPTRSKLTTLNAYLQNKDLLLVLDNCEHLITACAELAEQLLRACPKLRILTTSRERLNIGGETIWQVPPLSLPDLRQPLTFENLTGTEAGQLFIERAQAVQPGFRLTATTVEAIAQVCHRLDGLPLAIELAAARVKLLTVPQIATRLDDRFWLLTGGSRTALPRQQTLQAAIDWSYNLLTEPEQQLLRQLAVFIGGFTLEAAEAIWITGPKDAEEISSLLDLLSHLVDKSLIMVTQDREARYRMLEIIRQYVWERLMMSGEIADIRGRHLAYYLELAEQAELKIESTEQLAWMSRLEIEHDNFRAALAWSLENEQTEVGLRLAGALAKFWHRRYISEGSEWLERILARRGEAELVRAKALLHAGYLALNKGDYTQTLALAEESLTLYQRLDDKQGFAKSLELIGTIAHWQGDRDRGASLLQESLNLFRELGHEWDIAITLLYLGDLRSRQGNYEQASAHLQESLSLFQKLGDKWGLAFTLGGLGELARRQGNYQRAVAHFQQSLTLRHEQNNTSGIPFNLEALAITAAEQGQAEWAARLWGAAEASREVTHSALPPSYQADYAPYLEAARAALGTEAFAAAWAEGRALALEQAIALAMSLPTVVTPSPTAPAKTLPFGLTAREIEVLRLVATGLTDAQVAEKLTISPLTASKHLRSIYSKLHLSSRSAATRFAIEHNLL